MTHIRQFLTGPALFAFFDAPWFPIYLLVIFLFNVWLGVLATAGAVLLIGLACLNEYLTKKPLREASGYSQQSTQLATSHLHNAETIQAMGMLGRCAVAGSRCIHNSSACKTGPATPVR